MRPSRDAYLQPWELGKNLAALSPEPAILGGSHASPRRDHGDSKRRWPPQLHVLEPQPTAACSLTKDTKPESPPAKPFLKSWPVGFLRE